MADLRKLTTTWNGQTKPVLINMDQVRKAQRDMNDKYTVLVFEKDHVMNVDETLEQIFGN